MNIVSVPLAVLRVQYKIARFPLQVIEQQVMSRMPTEAPARLMYERGLGMLDGTVGSVLGDHDLVQRGSALSQRTDALARAAVLDEVAALKEQKADAELRANHRQANEQQEKAHEEKQREVARARAREEERKRAAVREAEERKAAAERQADEQAAQRQKAAEAAQRSKQAKIKAEEEKAAAPAKAQLKDAAAKQSEAADKRARADRVEELTEAEKAKRQNAKAAGNRS